MQDHPSTPVGSFATAHPDLEVGPSCRRKRKRAAGGGQPIHVAQLQDALLTLATASAVAGLSSASIYRKAKSDPTFPKLIRLGSCCTRIRARDLSAWIAAQAAKAEEVQVGNQPGAIGR